MTRRELLENIRAVAQGVYGEREAEAIARLVAEKRYGLLRSEIALEPLREVDEGADFGQLLSEIATARPVQYILGTADFYGLELTVGEGVLVPRPETEELVRWIIESEPDAREILDVGTGSGAIAIALAKNLPASTVTAIDISEDALSFARRNSEATDAGVVTRQGDALDSRLDVGSFDVIVSNPPYIPARERVAMAANVADFEPALALFVPDADPLVFYRAIARLAGRSLVAGGALYFEIHEQMADQIVELLEQEGLTDIEIRQDLNDKPRMARAYKR
ncbi:MAG: peptide chain release factor N(5)-glutamine methyltransferase [Rikenellaceae bacterium]|jgi:release factor glutamine methyltransferase|nr:peptide chain release factor N(5)-glutamine methyltransferase [Rikenellaceae bacterium]